MRPSIADLQKHVDEFFWRVRARAKPPISSLLAYILFRHSHKFPTNSKNVLWIQGHLDICICRIYMYYIISIFIYIYMTSKKLSSKTKTSYIGRRAIWGAAIKAHAWSLRQLVTQFGRAARRPHVPREAAMRSLFISAGIPLEGHLDQYIKPNIFILWSGMV